MDDEIQPQSVAFREAFGVAFKQSSFDSWRGLSEAADWSHSQIRKIMTGAFDHSRNGPGVFGVARAALQMGVDVGVLFPRQGLVRPGVNIFFSKYGGSGTSIENFKDLLDYCDLYAEPTAQKTNLLKVGKFSLLAEQSKLTDPALLQAEYDMWPNSRRQSIYLWQRAAWEAGALAAPGHFDGKLAVSPLYVRLSFMRAACRVVGDDGRDKLLVYAEPLGQDRDDRSHQ